MTTIEPKVPSITPSWRDEARLASTITLVAMTISVIVALAGPLGYLWLSYQSQITETSVSARLHAAFITLAIGESGGDWKASVAGLIDTELTPSELPEQRSIVDATGTTIFSSGPELSAPRLVRTAPLLDRQRTVGAVVVARSLGPLFWRTLLVALASSALGAATYLSLRVFPMRALRRTLGELRRHEAMARERAEEQLSIVLTTAIEGIVVFARSGAVLSCNPAASRLLEYTKEELEGVSVAKLFRVSQGPASREPLRVGQYEATALRSSGTEFPVEIAVSEMHATGENRRIAVIRDITERKENEARLARLANFDSLTQLPNRSVFRDQLNRAMARAREGNSSLALMFLDLDRFKNVNDSLGHEVGDQLLVAVASVLAGLHCEGSERVDAALGSSTHTVYRLGGDEFTVLIEGFRETGELIDLAQNVLAGLAQPFVIGTHELFVSASIGIAVYTEPDTELDDLIRHADMAMYRSKELGRDMFYFYSEEINREAAGRHQLEAQLRHALARDEFQLHYQPKMDMRTSRVTGVEALLRWQPRGREIVGPDHFIPILEETGLIVSVGAWVIKTAFAQMIAWQSAGMRPITLAINFSARQFRRHNLIESIGEALVETGFDPSLLEIELTESMLIEDTLATARILRALSGLGVSIAIDDFGTGHSSLTYLKRFDVDTLKIDRSFVRDMPEDPEDSAIASAVIALAHSLNLNVVAEGVETVAQMEFLIERGCDEMQGYLLSRPLEAEAFWLWFAEREALTAGSAAAHPMDPRLPLGDTRLLREA